MSKAVSPYANNTYDDENRNTAWYKILHMIPDGSRVLDVGCSTGNLGNEIKKKTGSSVWGIDITKPDIIKAKHLLEDAEVFDIENGKLSQSSITRRKYDVIIFADVLEHMKDPVRVLEKTKKLLRPNGRIIYSIPNMAHMFVRLQLLKGSFRYTETGLLDYTHLHFYDSNEVKRIFSDAGFSIALSDNTTFDYPPELLEEKLNEVGLKATQKFHKLASGKDAITFEYIGYVELGKVMSVKSKPPTDTTSPLDDVLGYVQRVKDKNRSELKELKAKLKLTEGHVSKLEDEIARLTHQVRVSKTSPRSRSALVAGIHRKIKAFKK